MACMDADTVHTDSAYTVDYAWHGILSPKTGLGPPLMRGGGHLLQMQPLSAGLFWLISIRSQIPPVPLEPRLLLGSLQNVKHLGHWIEPHTLVESGYRLRVHRTHI